ncbi:MAG TPA: nuclear transport factor 2 family protein [Halioglobus sp.]
MKIKVMLCALLLGSVSCIQVLADASPEDTLDALHKAGVDADRSAFLSLLTQDVVLLGMAGGNRLEGQSARDFVSAQFARGDAWAYRSRARDIRLSADGSVAWFDEALEQDQFGSGRGTGVLVRSDEGWKIAQYHLTLPLPASGAPLNNATGAPNNPAAAATQATEKQEKPKCQMISHKTNTRAKC